MHPALINYYYTNQGGSTPAYSPSAEMQLVIDEWDNLGYTKPSDSTIQALDEEFIIKRVVDGSWAKADLILIQAFNSLSTSSASTVNFKNPTGTKAQYVNSLSYGLLGITGDGLSSYMNTGFNPVTNGVNYIQNSASRSIWVANGGASVVLDGIISTSANRMIRSSTTGQRINMGTSSLNTAADLLEHPSYIAIDKPDSANVNLFKGLTKLIRTGMSMAMTSENQCVLRSVSAYGNSSISMYMMCGSLTDAQHNNIATDFQAYLTRIGL